MVLGVDEAALKVWLSTEALPRVSDADPAALADYIIELLDTLDLSDLDSSSTHSSTADSLRDFFDTHTDAFVTQLFHFLRRHRAQQPAQPQQQDRGEDRGEAQSRNGRSRSPSDERRRSRSRERSWEREHERGRRRRSAERDERADTRESGRGGRGRDAADDRGGSRRGSGTILIRDDRYGIKAVEMRDRERARGDYREGRDRGRQQPQQQQRWQQQQGHRGDSDGLAGSHAASRSPLLIQRPFVPAPATEPPARLARSVRLPASNPFEASAPAAQWTSAQSPPPSALPSAAVRRVGNHTVALRTRTAPAPAAAAAEAAVPSLLLHNAPRYVLSMRMLTDHFGMFGSVQGIEIEHSSSSAIIRFATAEEVSRALMGRPLHPDISMSISYTANNTPTSAAAAPQHSAAAQQQHEQQDAADEEADGEMNNGDEEEPTAAAAEPRSAAPAVAQMAVGRHTLTIRARLSPPPPLEPPSPDAPPAAPQPPAPGSALYAAEQIRRRKESEQQQPQQQAAGREQQGSREQRLSAMRLSLLQQQVDQSELLLNRCLAVMASSPPGSAVYLEAQRKSLDVEMSIEESRRKLSEERGRIVRMSLAAANAAAAAVTAT